MHCHRNSGRKEEALLRGLGEIADKGVAPTIVNYLLGHDVLTKFKGNEGWVYRKPLELVVPNRNIQVDILAKPPELRVT